MYTRNTIACPNRTHIDLAKKELIIAELKNTLTPIEDRRSEILQFSLLLPAVGFIAKKAIEDRSVLDKMLGISATLTLGATIKIYMQTPKDPIHSLLMIGKVALLSISTLTLTALKLVSIVSPLLYGFMHNKAPVISDSDLVGIAVTIASFVIFVFGKRPPNQRHLERQKWGLDRHTREFNEMRSHSEKEMELELKNLLLQSFVNKKKISWICVPGQTLPNSRKDHVFSSYMLQINSMSYPKQAYQEFRDEMTMQIPVCFMLANTKTTQLRLPKDLVLAIANLMVLIEINRLDNSTCEDYVQEQCMSKAKFINHFLTLEERLIS